MTVSLLGCQPKTDGEPAVSEDVTTVDSHEAHDEHVHEGHDHEAHDDMEHDHEGHDHESHNDMDVHEGHDHSEHASNSTPFSCEPTATIGVYYHTDATPQTAHLLIDGIEYDLTAASGSDALTDKTIYTSDIGLDNTHGIIWQVDGDNATLLNKTLNSDVSIEEEDVLFDCQKS
ncbi:hypothetical protein QO189_01740 [Psychrobacter sp. Arc29]|uniref:hypothetical protein n=1 Tax=Psychrobacter sp. Arc29 TaxID=3046690 RepID=UPI00352DB1D0